MRKMLCWELIENQFPFQRELCKLDIFSFAALCPLSLWFSFRKKKYTAVSSSEINFENHSSKNVIAKKGNLQNGKPNIWEKSVYLNINSESSKDILCINTYFCKTVRWETKWEKIVVVMLYMYNCPYFVWAYLVFYIPSFVRM